MSGRPGWFRKKKTAARAIQARRLLGRLEPDTLRRLLALCAAHRPEQAAAFAALQTAAGRLQAENACCRVGQLAVNGRDLMALGAKPGRACADSWRLCWKPSSPGSSPTNGKPCWQR